MGNNNICELHVPTSTNIQSLHYPQEVTKTEEAKQVILG